jgi:hypothetical protein
MERVRFRKREYFLPAAMLVVFMARFSAATENRGSSAQAVRIDGTSMTGKWLGSDGGDAIRLEGEGREHRLGVDELSSVRFDAAAVAPKGPVVVHLADGGALRGELTGGQGDAILVDTFMASSLRLSFRDLGGIRLVQGEEHAAAAELFDAALESRLAGQDVLITRGPDEVKALRGRLEELNAERGAFVFGDRTRTFQNDKLYGIVFAAGLAKPASHLVTVELADGSRFSGELEHADETRVRMRASFGVTLELAVTDIERISIRSPRVEYVSDLKVAAERIEGVVHRPWPVRRDQSVSARPLSLGGRTFDKGLGVHSLTELTFEIGGEYESFVATIGIDDAVRPRGSVVFRISGDGRELFNSGEIRGSDEPRDVRVEVTGVRLLTLSVDFGDGLDVSDHANWGGARLIRPSGGRPRDNRQ